MVWQNLVNALIGIWFIVAPFVLGLASNTREVWTSLVGGAILLILAGSAALYEQPRRQAWIQYVNGLVGIWFIVAPWVLLLQGRLDLVWTSVVGGIIALVLSAWLALAIMPSTVAQR